MSRSLHRWIAIRRERKQMLGKARALYWYLREKLPPWHQNHESLMHLMMRADFLAYQELGKPITGLAWAKGSDGVPIPKWPKVAAR